jgi:hypothetical protein
MRNNSYNYIVDLIKKYKEEIGNDLVINDFNIKEVQLRLPARKHFWAARLIDAKIELHSLQKQKKALKKQIVKRLQQEAPIKLTQQSAEIAAESSNEISSLNDQIKEYEFVIEYLDKATSVLNQVGWDIKNIIEIQKLEQL